MTIKRLASGVTVLSVFLIFVLSAFAASTTSLILTSSQVGPHFKTLVSKSIPNSEAGHSLDERALLIKWGRVNGSAASYNSMSSAKKGIDNIVSSASSFKDVAGAHKAFLLLSRQLTNTKPKNQGRVIRPAKKIGEEEFVYQMIDLTRHHNPYGGFIFVWRSGATLEVTAVSGYPPHTQPQAQRYADMQQANLSH